MRRMTRAMMRRMTRARTMMARRRSTMRQEEKEGVTMIFLSKDAPQAAVILPPRLQCLLLAKKKNSRKEDKDRKESNVQTLAREEHLGRIVHGVS
jgi:hypothetical protein